MSNDTQVPNTIVNAMCKDEISPPSQPCGMKIVKLTAQNVKKLSAVEIEPDGNLVVIGGKNGAGKTSVLDSIMYALAGGKSIASKPIRNGKKSGKITVELDGIKRLTVERRLSDAGGSLEIRTADGFKASSPQAILDGLCGKIAFDPLEFTKMSPAKQAETLRGLVGLDFTDIDAERKRVFDQRTDVNRQAKALKARVDSIVISPNAPTEYVNVGELMTELKRRQDINQENRCARNRVENWKRDEADQLKAILETESDIVGLEKRLSEVREELKALKTDLDNILLGKQKCESEVAALSDADTAEVEQKIASAESVNAQVRKSEERRELETQLASLLDTAGTMSDDIEKLDAAKESQLASAQWPIARLGFNESGVTFNGLPFEQSSSAEQLRVSVAIGLALNPTLRVLLIRDGSLLDADSMKTIAGMAQEADGQLWIERVGEGAECSVIIEDGHLKNLTESNQ
jgi:DNA repair exonuclease SbcCD ATPase subunit